MKLLVATNNAGKVREYNNILQNLLPQLTLLTLDELGIKHEVEETGQTFEENARLKATIYARLSALPVIADDSGIMVEALGGFPGVKSARWAGPSDRDRNRALLERLRDVPSSQRGAKFVCVAVFRTPNGQEAVGHGEVSGRIAEAPRGDNGFGYDPLFLLPDRDRTMAELSEKEKNALSHRGRAAQAIAPAVRRLIVAR